jgi:hypothetical protein
MAPAETRDQARDIEQDDRHFGAMSTVPAKWLRNSRAVALGNASSRSGPQGRVLYLLLSLDLDHRLLERIVQDLAIAGAGKQQAPASFQ